MTDPDQPQPPLLRVIHGGDVSAEELAALVTVVTAAASGGEAEPEPSLRTPLSAWVASGLVKGTRTKA